MIISILDGTIRHTVEKGPGTIAKQLSHEISKNLNTANLRYLMIKAYYELTVRIRTDIENCNRP